MWFWDGFSQNLDWSWHVIKLCKHCPNWPQYTVPIYSRPYTCYRTTQYPVPVYTGTDSTEYTNHIQVARPTAASQKKIAARPTGYNPVRHYRSGIGRRNYFLLWKISLKLKYRLSPYLWISKISPWNSSPYVMVTAICWSVPMPPDDNVRNVWQAITHCRSLQSFVKAITLHKYYM
jgi:hypothetical protein